METDLKRWAKEYKLWVASGETPHCKSFSDFEALLPWNCQHQFSDELQS